ncbi:hypothetical protein SAMN05216267_103918 [Actinacidiphila rubida]|uniref:Uncharacterized protein n=1 Tax=Actinacidiphila rubida TaxID=310780 RepID=A0A1H8S484_9ACTN|nr:hypothetical protein SAMN05216267_103918 [Actinacidiphila rubida]
MFHNRKFAVTKEGQRAVAGLRPRAALTTTGSAASEAAAGRKAPR